MEKIIYGCSSTDSKKKLNEIKTKMLDYFNKNIAQCKPIMDSFADVDYDEVPDELCEYSILVESVIEESEDGIRYVNYMTDDISSMIRANMSSDDSRCIISTANTLIGVFQKRVSEINQKCTRMNEIMTNVSAEQSVRTPIQTSQGVTNLLSGMCAEVEALDQELGERIADVRAGLVHIDQVFADFDRREAIEDAEWAEFDARHANDSSDSDDDFDWSIYDD
jgi:hypothetical protein